MSSSLHTQSHGWIHWWPVLTLHGHTSVAIVVPRGCNACQQMGCTPILNWLVPSLLTLPETLAQFVPLFSLSLGFGCQLEHSQLRAPEEAEAAPHTTRSKPFAVFTDNNFRLTLSTWYIGSPYITLTVACHVMSAKVNVQCDMIGSNTVQGYCLLS